MCVNTAMLRYAQREIIGYSTSFGIKLTNDPFLIAYEIILCGSDDFCPNQDGACIANVCYPIDH